MLVRALCATALLAYSPIPAVPQTLATCSKPIPVPPGVTTPNSTYYSDSEPPARFAHVPAVTLRIRFGARAIERLCGKPPCDMEFLGCTDGENMALPNPYTTDSAQFAKIVRHELGHVNGWPETHGD